jgi:hypothetical protein
MHHLFTHALEQKKNLHNIGQGGYIYEDEDETHRRDKGWGGGGEPIEPSKEDTEKAKHH